jgi:hypothetical protein
MKMIKTTVMTFMLLLAMLKVSGQTVVLDLNGFRIGQYRETATNEFGKPVQQGKYEDGFEYEAFIINQDTSLYMVFEYAEGHTDVIWSIQISGNNTTTNIGFKDLKLGIDKKEVLRALGKPVAKDDIGDFGEKWNYDKTNYSVEISKSGKLSSVKITNTYLSDTPDLNKLPKFASVVKLLTSKNNAEIASVLAPGVEIYRNDQTLFFGKSLKTEIETDYSKIFQTIREISNELDKINTSDENVYEENVRLVLGQNPMHVIKIKKGHAIKEIVFDYINGQYLIWEINAQ